MHCGICRMRERHSVNSVQCHIVGTPQSISQISSISLLQLSTQYQNCEIVKELIMRNHPFRTSEVNHLAPLLYISGSRASGEKKKEHYTVEESVEWILIPMVQGSGFSG